MYVLVARRTVVRLPLISVAPMGSAESCRSPCDSGVVMVYFKSCPRCSGDRVLEHDFYGWYILCLACGHVTYPRIDAEAVPAGHGSQKTA